MANLILPSRFNQQPQGPVEVDWGSDLARDITAIWTPFTASTDLYKNVVRGTLSTSTAITVGVSRFGITHNTGQNGLQLPGTQSVTNPPGVSALIIGGRPPTGQSWSVGIQTPYGTFRKWAGEYAVHTKGGHYTRFATATQWPVEPAVVIAGRSGPSEIASAYRFWVNGVSAANTLTSGTSAFGGIAYDVMQGATGDRSAATYWAAPTALIVQWAHYLSDAEAVELSANPWQLFRAKPRVLYFDVAGGSATSTVFSDLGDSYALRAHAVSDLGDSYAIRAAIAADLADGYSLRAAASGDLDDSYLLRAGASADLDDAYALRSNVSSDLGDAYVIDSATSVGSILDDSYTIRTAVSGDLGDSYAVRGSVSGDLEDAYLLRAGVAAEFVDLYSLRGFVSSDLADAYLSAGVVSSDLADSYAIQSEIAPTVLSAARRTYSNTQSAQRSNTQSAQRSNTQSARRPR